MNQSNDTAENGDRLNPVVFYGSSIAIVVFSLWTIFFTATAESYINAVLGWVSNSFGWYYFLTVFVYLVFVIAIALSRFGDIKLRPAHSKPEFNILSWAAMLFAAGIGIDLLFFCIAEPITQFLSAPAVEGMGDAAAARHAMELTFLHWGVSGWGIYTLVGMSLAYFSYRHNLPLTIRSALYPIFGKGIYGPIGHTVDIAAVLGTVFGIATSLGIGVIQLNAGLQLMFGVPESTITQAALVVMIIVFAAISAVTGVERGIRRLSEFNMALALLLMLFVLFAGGQTIFLLNALVTNIGDYFTNFVDLSFNTYAFDQPTEWLNAWTLFFWAWWIAWGPFVGLFLARISRGRTIRQFVVGTLTLPMAFMMVWMAVMGNSGIAMVMGGAADFGQLAMNEPATSIYKFLEQLPWAGLTTVVTTILAIVFFVTSGDSGALVLSNFTSILKDVNSDAPIWMRILWATVIGLVTLALLMAGGLTALQSTTVIMGLPFSIVLFFIMAGLYKGLKAETLKKDASPIRGRRPHRGAGSSGSWEQRLKRAMSFPDYNQAQRVMTDAVRPAMDAVRQALTEQGMAARVDKSEARDEFLSLYVDLGDDDQDFYYRVQPNQAMTPAFAIRPHREQAHYYQLEVHLQEGGQGYDLMDCNKEEVIDDILDQYERHLDFLQKTKEASGNISIPGTDPQTSS